MGVISIGRKFVRLHPKLFFTLKILVQKIFYQLIDGTQKNYLDQKHNLT